MNKPSILKKASIGVASLLVGIMLSGAVASAIPYTGDTTVASPVPAFNVFTGNMPAPAPAGSEADFFQGRVPAGGDVNEGTTPFADPVSTTCTNGEIIQLHIYVHNGASVDGNNNGTGPSVAHNTHVKVNLPAAAASAFDPTASISASNAASVSDGLHINCGGQTVQLQYIAGSASQFSAGSGVLGLSDAIVGAGVPIQSDKVSGDVWGCWNSRVFVVLAVKVVVTPPKPPVTAMCNLFSVEASADRKVTVSQFKFTATNSNFKNVVVNWGDNTPNLTLTTPDLIGQTHSYAADGTYNINAVVTFSVPGQADVTSGGAGTACATQVTFTSNKPPTVTPPTTPPVTPPSTLVNTGAGSTLGLFAAATVGGTLAYRRLLARRLSRQ